MEDGKLGKFGKILDSTPASVREEFATTTTKDPAKSAAAATGVAVKKEPVEAAAATPKDPAAAKKEPVEAAEVETLSAVSTATPTAVALSAKRKVLNLHVISSKTVLGSVNDYCISEHRVVCIK